MRGILDREYGQSHILRVSPDTPTATLRKVGIHCIYGHCRYGLHQHFRQKTTYITFLRDPLDRILSMFYYIRSRPQNKMHDTVKQMSLREFVTTTEPRIQVPLHNHQTRMISGKKQPDLKTAIDNIKKDFAVVGVTDMYPESVFMMRKALGWDDASYKKANVTRKRRKKTDIPPKVKQIVREHNQLDYELYAFAKEQLHYQIQNLPPQEQRQLAVFKQKQSR